MIQALRAGPPEADRTDLLLAHALGCPHDRGGLVLAVRHACRCLAAAATVVPARPALQEWHDAAVAMSERLKAQCATQPLLLTTSAEMLALPSYGVWLSPPQANATDSRVQHIWAAQGHALAVFACAGNVVPPALLNGLTQTLKYLRGGTKQQGWAEIAEAFPMGAAETQQWVGKTNVPAVRRMLGALETMWSMPLVSPDMLTEHVTTREHSAREDADPSPQDADEALAVDQGAADEDARPASLLGWLIQRANYAGMRSRFGADGRWDALTPDELKHVCQAIRSDLQARSDAARFALLAVVCLCSSLPARLAMSLPLQPNGDLWVADDFASLRWSLQRLLEGRSDDASTTEQLLPNRVVDIALPSDAARVGLELKRARANVASLAELLTAATEPAVQHEFIEAYRAWLRGLGPGWAHAVYDARFALSLSQIYRAQHGDVAAGWLSLDFRELALGMVHYIGLPRAMLHLWAGQAYAEIGLGAAAGDPPLGRVGSAVALDVESFAKGWHGVQAACETHRASLATCADVIAATQVVTELNIARLAAVVIAMAGRGSLLARLTWEVLYAHDDVTLLMDKRLDSYSDLRGIPVHALLREQLDAHLEDLQLFAAACRRLGHSPFDRRGRDLTRPQARGAAFYGLQVNELNGTAAPSRMAITTGDVDKLAQRHFGQPINVGRHTLLSLAVQKDWDPWLAKALCGHHRGHAEPFSDGGAVAPAHLLSQLRDALDAELGHLVVDRKHATSTRFVLRLSQLQTPPSLPPPAQARASGSKARLLPPAWQPSTLVAVRACDYLRHRLAAGEGPSFAGAEALLAGLLVNGIAVDDLRVIWIDHRALQGVGDRGAVALWRRSPGSQEQQRLVSPLWAIALLRARSGKGHLPAWDGCVEQAARWLRTALPDFGWPSDDYRSLRLLEQLFQAWLRYHMPPFMLSAAHPALGAAVANRLSLSRLATDEPSVDGGDDILLLQAPAPRATARVPMRESALSQVLKQVHRFGRIDLHLGEDDQLWRDLLEEVSKLDCSADARAKAVAGVVRLDHDRWRAAHRNRIQVSSLSTYLYRITADLERIAPSEDLSTWREEWEDWFEGVERASVAADADKRAAMMEERLVAVRHLLRGLSELRFPVPKELLVADGKPVAALARRPASATVLFRSDRQRIRRLLKRHFADIPLLGELADLYCALVFSASLRSAEVGALPIDAVTPFGDLVVDSSGFSHLKSDHARRLQHLPDDVVESFHDTAKLVQEAEPGARWIFLLNEPSNWSSASTVAKAVGAALRQVTGDADARQHSTRPLAPLAQLLPGWEDALGAVARGRASVQECRAFMSLLQDQGVGRLVQVLYAAGHGHPLTFLTHYFSVWPWVLGSFALGSHVEFGDAAKLVRSRMPQAYPALRKARQRAHEASVAFDSWTWAGRVAVGSMELPALRVERGAPSAKGPPPPAGPGVEGGNKALVQYLAARFMDLAPAAAAHAFGLSNALAAKAEAHYVEGAAAALRHRHQGGAQGRGRGAELKLLRGEEGAALAARFVALPGDDLRRLAETLSSQRSGPQPWPSVDALIARLQADAAALLQRYGLLVQTGKARYDAEDLARLPASSAQLFLGPADRDLGNRPRVSVVDADAPGNRVRRARLTSLVRCLAQAALTIRSN